VVDRATFEQGANGVDGDAGGLVAGEGLQPARHGGDGDKRGAGEEKDKHGQDRGHLRGLRILHGQADSGVGPGQGVSEDDDEGDAGRVLALLGPNAAGKTTLVRVLATFLPCSVP
jgi:hypothetical protein